MKKLLLAILLLLASLATATTTYSYWIADDGSAVWAKWNVTNSSYVYGNGTTARSSIDSTFIEGDDFNANGFNTSKWINVGSVSVTQNGSGSMQYNTGTHSAKNGLHWNGTFTENAVMIIAGFLDNNGCSGDCRTGIRLNQTDGTTYKGCEFQALAPQYEAKFAAASQHAGTWVDNTRIKAVYTNISNKLVNCSYILGNGTSFDLNATDSTLMKQIGITNGGKGTLNYVALASAQNVSPTITYGLLENGSWTIGNETYTQRVQVNVTNGASLIDQQIELNISKLPSGVNLLVSNETGKSFAVTFISPTDASGSTLNRSYIEATASSDDSVNITISLYDGTGTFVTSVFTNSSATLSANFTGLTDGAYHFNATAGYATGPMNFTETRNVTVDAAPPNVSLLSPAAGANITTNSQVFSFNFTDVLSSTANCSIYIDNIKNQTNATTLNNTNTNFTVPSFSVGVHNWTVNCTDTSNHTGTATRNFNATWDGIYSYCVLVNVTGWTCSGAWCQHAFSLNLNESATNGSDIIVYDSTRTQTYGLYRSSSASIFNVYTTWNYATAAGNIWVNAPYNTTQLYVCYGTNGGTDRSAAGAGLLSGSDDFSTFNASKWLNCTTGSGTATIPTPGYLVMTGGDPCLYNSQLNTSNTQNFSIEMSVNSTALTNSNDHAYFMFGKPSDAWGFTNHELGIDRNTAAAKFNEINNTGTIGYGTINPAGSPSYRLKATGVFWNTTYIHADGFYASYDQGTITSGNDSNPGTPETLSFVFGHHGIGSPISVYRSIFAVTTAASYTVSATQGPQQPNQGTPPQVANLTWTPVTAHKNDTLTCSAYVASYSASTLNISASFYKNGAYQFNSTLDGAAANVTYNFTLGSGNLTQLQNWSCQIAATDNVSTTTSMSSNITILNYVPAIGSLSLLPAVPGTNDTLNVSFVATDQDNGTMNVTISWYKNGVLNGSLNSTQAGVSNGTMVSALLGPGNLTVLDNWSAYVSVTDGYNTTAAMSANVTVLNDPPQITSASFTPNPAVYTDDLLCSFIAISPNNATMNATFRFYKNGVLQPALNATSTGISSGSTVSHTLAHGNISVGDIWGCQITLTDGYSTVNQNTSNVTVQTTSVTLLMPADNATIYGSPIFSYSVVTPSPAVCAFYVNGTVKDSQIVASSTTISVSANLSSGTYLWQVNCMLVSNASVTFSSSIWHVVVVIPSGTTLITLSLSPESVLAAPQAIYYDTSGYLNFLYFEDNVTDILHLYVINGAAVLDSYNASLNATKPFFVAMRGMGVTRLLMFDYAASTKYIFEYAHGSSAVLNTSATVYSTVTANTNVDPYTYADTTQFSNLSLDNSSYYLMLLPTTNGTRLVRLNVTDYVLEGVANTSLNMSVAWQTHAATSDLASWYYAWPRNASSTTAYISIYYYNGTSTLNVTPDSATYNKTKIEGAKVYFEAYGNKTYFFESNVSTHAFIYLIEENKTLQLNYSASDPGHFKFIDQYTFVFFSSENGTTYAYSCYFAGTPSCTRMTPTQYGATVPYIVGTMVTAWRNGTSDVVTTGSVYSSDTVILALQSYVYDAKFMCYDEVQENRQKFTLQIYTNMTANILQNASWGYVLPSSILGNGTKRAYSLGENGTTRLYVVGLTSFAMDLFSLNVSQGQYYVFTIKDAFGQIVPDVILTAYRFSNAKQAWVVVEQGITDYTGTTTFFLQPYTLYQMSVQKSGYVTLAYDFIPATTTSIAINLAAGGNMTIPMPNYDYMWNDTSFSLSPSGYYSSNATNVTFLVASSTGQLEYYGMQVRREFNGTSTVVYSANISAQPSGGILQYQVDQSGMYYVNAWFKHQAHPQYNTLTKIFQYGNVTGFAKAREEFLKTNPIGAWGFYFVAVVAAMLVGGFVSRYTYEGAGLAALVVLWMFTLFNPDAQLVCVAGLSGCITSMHATILTSFAVLAATYYVWRGA